MKKFMAVWQLFSAIMLVVQSEKGQDTLDNIFDMLEDNFPVNHAIQNACMTGRTILNVPDDGD